MTLIQSLKSMRRTLCLEKKYSAMILILCEYVNRVAVNYVLELGNKECYREHLAATSVWFSYLFKKDGLRFLRSFETEAERIKTGMLIGLPEGDLDQWNEFEMQVRLWQQRYYAKTIKKGGTYENK